MAARNGPAGYGWVSKTLHWVTVVAVATQAVLGLAAAGTESAALLSGHLVVGATVIVLALARVGWRRTAGLPPWSEHLTESQRRLAHRTERALLTMLFVVPATGLALLASGDDDLLPLHVVAQLLLLAALVAHLSTNLRPRILTRMT